MIRHLHREQFVPGAPARIWEFFATPHNLNELTPPGMSFEIIGAVAPRMYAGQLIEYRVDLLPGMKVRWLTEITHVCEREYFVDEQRCGPYKLWHHEHRFTPTPDGLGVQMADKITYDPGWGPLGGLADALWIKRQLARIFDYRAQRVTARFARQS